MQNSSHLVSGARVTGQCDLGRFHWLLQHMRWHEGYHHGQMKLALKVAGRPITDKEAGPVAWGVWMRKKKRS